MPRGGARNRSGPQPDPSSGRSDRRGLRFSDLPAEGHKGPAPEFPLPTLRRYRWEFEEKRKFQVFDPELTEAFRDRELAVWAWAWSTPQAAAWAREEWRWQVVAEFCRLKTVVEADPDSNASLVAQLHRYRDQVGLTPAGLRENGWQVVADEVGGKRTVKPAVRAPQTRRLRVAGDGGA